VTRSQRARRTRDRLCADAPHYTRAEIATAYVADRLRIDIEAAERLGARPPSVMVGDTSPMSLLRPAPPRLPSPNSPPPPSLSQLLAPSTP
jgi:hypothetical protein